MSRCLEFCFEGGTTCIVTTQNWLFLTTYKKYRENLLKENCWNVVAKLGAKAFQTPMWDFNVQLLSITKGVKVGSSYDGAIVGFDVSSVLNAELKPEALQNAIAEKTNQKAQLSNPDARINFGKESNLSLLKEYADGLVGIQTGDDPRYSYYFGKLMLTLEIRGISSKIHLASM